MPVLSMGYGTRFAQRRRRMSYWNMVIWWWPILTYSELNHDIYELRQIICNISWIISRRNLSFCQDLSFPTLALPISCSPPAHLSHKPCYSFCMPTRNFPVLWRSQPAMHMILLAFYQAPQLARSTPLPVNTGSIGSKPLLCCDNWLNAWVQVW